MIRLLARVGSVGFWVSDSARIFTTRNQWVMFTLVIGNRRWNVFVSHDESSGWRLKTQFMREAVPSNAPHVLVNLKSYKQNAIA